MGLSSGLIKFAVKKFGKTASKKIGKKVRTAAQKRGLAKAVKASALARKKLGSKSVVKLSRRVTRSNARVSAIKKVEKLGLKRVTRGTTLKGQKRVSNSLNFKGKAGRALKKSSYKARLESSRAKYHTSSLKNRAGQKALGLVSYNSVTRRKYVDLTAGENFRRNLSRNLKISLAVTPVTVALAAKSLSDIQKLYKPKIIKEGPFKNSNTGDSQANALTKKYKAMA